jgi:hypothetical protein
MKESHIALVGNGTTTKDSLDFQGEIWTTASVAKILPRVDLVFEVHKNGIDVKYDPARLNSYSCLIMTDGIYPDLKNSVDLKIDELAAKYRPLFQFSYDYMMAYAIDIGVKSITLFGIDLMTELEYASFRTSFYYWIGRAEGMGIRVTVSEGSMILANPKTYCHGRDLIEEKVEYALSLIDKAQPDIDEAMKKSTYQNASSRGYRECLDNIIRSIGV